tara:strand:+ start:110 stop:547 length:438 start_codon:yes stop_codon:yes gene_type:complete
MKTLLTLIGLLMGFAMTQASAVELKPDDKATIAKGKSVYKSQCAACHGFRLRGQRNWRVRNSDGKLPAPPHDKSGHTWHHSSKQLFELTKFGPKALIGGDYQTDMPGYKDILSDEEIIAVLSYIKSTWPPNIRERHDAVDHNHKH